MTLAALCNHELERLGLLTEGKKEANSIQSTSEKQSSRPGLYVNGRDQCHTKCQHVVSKEPVRGVRLKEQEANWIQDIATKNSLFPSI